MGFVMHSVVLAFELQVLFALMPIKPAFIRFVSGLRGHIVFKGGEVRLPQLPLALWPFKDLQLFHKRRFLNGRGGREFFGQLSGSGDECHIDQHTAGIGPGQRLIALFPSLNAVIDVRHDLRGKHDGHDFPKPGNKQGSHVQYIQADVEVMLDALEEREAVNFRGGHSQKTCVIDDLEFLLFKQVAKQIVLYRVRRHFQRVIVLIDKACVQPFSQLQFLALRDEVNKELAIGGILHLAHPV